MNLQEIEEAISSDSAFKSYIEQEGEGGETALVLDLIIQAIEQDGASLADYELLTMIKDITDLHKNYTERGKQ